MASSSETSILDRARVSLGTRLLGGRKAVEQLRFAPLWAKHAWSDIAFRALAKEGYKANAAVYACVQAWAQAFPEPEMMVRSRAKDGATEWLYEHPARALVNRPNPFMGEDEFWSFVITYMALGGNCYIWKERANSRVPIALWPMHDGQIRPIPGETPADGWISHYIYDDGSGESGVRLETTDVIHLRWAVDPLQPTRGLSPLIAAARSVDTANEAMRYQFALLKNDAVVSTLVSLKEPIGKARIQALKQQFRDSFGGDNRGEVAFAEGSEMTISRLGANLQELAIEALLNVPEANIAAVFEVPPGLAGLNVALQRPAGLGSVGDTAVQEFTQRRLVPKWRRIGSQFTAQLLPDFGNARGLSLEFDTTVVQALREDEAGLMTSINGAVAAGYLTVNEARARLNKQPVASGDVFLRGFSMIEVPASPAVDNGTDEGSANFTGIQIDKALAIVASVAAGTVARVDGIAQLVVLLGMTDAQATAIMGQTDAPPALPPPAPEPTSPPPGDGGGSPAPPTGSKGRPPRRERKEAVSKSARDLARQVAQDARGRRAKLAAHATDPVAKALGGMKGKVVSRADGGASKVDALLEDGDAKDLHAAIRATADGAARDAHEHASSVLGVTVPYDVDAPGMQKVFDAVGERIVGIDATTRDRVQGYLNISRTNGWTPAELAKHIEADESGAFNRSRAELIARTETALVYAGGSAAAYRTSGRVEKVIIFDGEGCGWEGHDDPDPADGSVRTLDEYEATPLAHPNCERAAAPWFDMGDDGGDA